MQRLTIASKHLMYFMVATTPKTYHAYTISEILSVSEV